MNYELRISNCRRILIILTVSIFLISKAFAAELSFEMLQDQVSVGHEFELILYLDTQKENINAIEGRISYPNNLEIQDIKDGNSVINLWIEKPRLKAGKIIFAGITPGGVITKRGKIFSIIFRAKNFGGAIVSVLDTRALLNDGSGAPARLKAASLKFNVLEQPTMSQISFIAEDKDPPNPFQPQISSDPNIFEGKKFIVFVAQDKGSGVDHYEIKESWFGSWRKAESPHLLRDQQLKSYIYVRAVDKAGNVQTVTISPQAVVWYMNFRLWIIIIICCALAFFYFFCRSRRWR